MMRPLEIPDPSLVVLIGASGAGKSTLARRLFEPTEILTSDTFRALVSDDENDQSASPDAFEVLHAVAGKRLARRRLTVVDATNVQKDARAALLAIARAAHLFAVAVVLDLPTAVCEERNRARPDRRLGRHVVRQQHLELRRSRRGLAREGFRFVHVLRSAAETEAATIERRRLWTDRRDDRGPFDVVGDVHGCFDELVLLLEKLGWRIEERPDAEPRFVVEHPEGRRLVFLGDLVDRGPKTPAVLRLAMDAVASGRALAVPGNHDVKLVKALGGKNVRIAPGLARSLEQLAAETPAFRARVAGFLDALVSHYELDEGRLVVAHAGLREDLQGRSSGTVRDFALYGETTGERDDLGLPVRGDWARDYEGRALVVYGHTPVAEPAWVNGTINVDTGCVFGGRLTALRYPEKELVSVAAARVYFEPPRPLATPAVTAPPDDLLDALDLLGRRSIETRHAGWIRIGADAAAAALEASSRFAVDPRWLITLPPTMAPSETSRRPGRLEHPAEAFAHYEKAGVRHLVCEEKHMGSRALLVFGRDLEAVRRRFGVEGDELGVCLTRTGRRFFADPTLEGGLVAEVRDAAQRAGLFAELETDWLCLDAELMPWSLKARELLVRQYAPVGAAGEAALGFALDVARGATNQDLDLGPLVAELEERRDLVARYRAAYRRYCWQVGSLADVRLAPFHLLASEGAVHTGRDHLWHLERLDRLAAASSGVVVVTARREVDLDDPASRDAAVAWWRELTSAGGEGIVVKPRDFLVRGRRGLVQPALKCRGPEYLRIIYGPEYSREANLERLRSRAVGRKRALALRELALGLEALHRFVERAPLRRVHECVFGVLALESEPIDPRL